VPKKTESATRPHVDLNEGVGRFESKLFRSPDKPAGSNQPQQTKNYRFHWSPDRNLSQPVSFFKHGIVFKKQPEDGPTLLLVFRRDHLFFLGGRLHWWLGWSRWLDVPLSCGQLRA
jgi:hypothetical protein